MAITSEEFKLLQPGDLIRIREEINGVRRSENGRPYWARFLGDVLTVRDIFDNSTRCHCVESTDGGLHDVVWSAKCIEDIVRLSDSNAIVAADDSAIKSLFE